MDTITINFKASGQNLTADAHPQRYASNTVNYIQAVFDLDENWQSFDSVRAVWHNDFACISTVLDSDGACTVPHEVLTNLDEVIVNLVGSDVDGEELVDRMTTYPLKVAIIDANARICGTETAEVTPSQFEQFIAQVAELVGSVRDIDRIELNEDYTLTVYYSDGTSWTSTSIRGEQGETGNGIASAVLNDDYTLTLTFTDGTSYTTSSIRGEQGPQGEPGEVTLAQLESVLPTDTASGAIASFPDGSDLFDYLSCICDINPVQDLHGYEKPWVGGAGRNKWDEQWENGSPDGTANYIVSKNFSPCVEGTTYYFKCGDYTNMYYMAVYWFDENETQLSYTYVCHSTAVAPTDAKYFKIRTNSSTYVYGGTYLNDICVNVSDASFNGTYQPYENICPITGWTGCNVVVSPTQDAQDGTTYPVSWQTEAGTVYGGTVDVVSGVLTVTWVSITFDGTQSWYSVTAGTGANRALYANMTDPPTGAYSWELLGNYIQPTGFAESMPSLWKAEFNPNGYLYVGIPDTITTTSAWETYLASNPLQICYELATPQTYQLTETDIACLLGQNNVWADCGDIEEVKYKADVQRWVDKMLNA